MKTLILLLVILSPFSMNFHQIKTISNSWSKSTITKLITDRKESNQMETQSLKCHADKNCSAEKNVPMVIWLFCSFIIVMTSPRRKIIPYLTNKQGQ